MANHLHIDPFSGIAGDMFLGALLDLGLDLEALRQALAPLPIQPGYTLASRRVQKHGIGGVDLQVHLDTDDGHRHDHGHGHGHHHHHTGYRQIMAMIEQLDTTERGRGRARAIVTVLAEAEARVHGCSVESVHFHEVGAVDSIVDMLGAAAGLELLGVDSLSCGRLPLSDGFVRCAHGLMPVPAPATAYLLEGLPTFGVPRQGELVTPTGAALVRALCGSFGPPPAMTLQGVGYGAGDRDDPDVPNLLRLLQGEVTAAVAQKMSDAADRRASPARLATAAPSDAAKSAEPGHHHHHHDHAHGHDHDHDHAHDHKHAPAGSGAGAYIPGAGAGAIPGAGARAIPGAGSG